MEELPTGMSGTRLNDLSKQHPAVSAGTEKTEIAPDVLSVLMELHRSLTDLRKEVRTLQRERDEMLQRNVSPGAGKSD